MSSEAELKGSLGISCVIERDGSHPGTRMHIYALPPTDSPEDLRYACRYWAHHLRQSKESTLRTEALSFLKCHFLHWLEAISLMGGLSETLEMMVTLKDSIQVRASVVCVSKLALPIHKCFLLFQPHCQDRSPAKISSGSH